MSKQKVKADAASVKNRLDSGKAAKRLSALFDDGVYTEIGAYAASVDDLAEVTAAHGNVDGLGVYAFAQRIDVSGGAMSRAQASKIKKVYDLALKTGEPVVAMYDSVGGRLQEGSELLAAYGDVLKYSNNLSGVVPQISVVLGSCYGTQALIAACGDIVIMSEQAGFSLNTGGTDSSAEENARHGIAHILARDENEAIKKTRELISVLPSNNLSTACVVYDSIDAQKEVNGNMTASDAAFAVADAESLIELQPEYGKAAKTAVATLNCTTVGLVALDAKELDSKSCGKASRFVRFCDAFSIPVVTFIDAEAFECIKGAAKLTSAYAEATSAKVTVITGNAFGSVYIAAAGTGAAADMTYAWPGASVSALTPEAAAVVMLGDDFGGKLKGSKDPEKDREKLISDYQKTELNAMKAAADGYVDDIIEPSQTRAKLISALDMLCNKRVSTMPKKHNNLYI